MAEFDVFRNPGRQRDTIPFIVVLQNKRLDRIGTRFVASLVAGKPPAANESHLTPSFVIEGRQVTMDVFNLTTVLADRLGKPVASLTDEDSRAKLVRAVDEFISQA